jgi:hypothetical protein
LKPVLDGHLKIHQKNFKSFALGAAFFKLFFYFFKGLITTICLIKINYKGFPTESIFNLYYSNALLKAIILKIASSTIIISLQLQENKLN